MAYVYFFMMNILFLKIAQQNWDVVFRPYTVKVMNRIEVDQIYQKSSRPIGKT